MKLRIISIGLILALTPGPPVLAQQNTPTSSSAPQAQAPPAATDSGKTVGKPACGCCGQNENRGKDTKSAKTLSCCENKQMGCSRKEAQNGRESLACCSGKEGKQCGKKEDKGCCGKQSMAGNSKDGKNCSAGHATCTHRASQG